MKTLDSGNSRPLPDLAPSGRAPSHALRIRITLILVAVVLTIWAAVGFNILQ